MRIANSASRIADAIQYGGMPRCDDLGGLQHSQGRTRIVAREQGTAQVAKGFNRRRIKRMRGLEHADRVVDPVQAEQGDAVQTGRLNRLWELRTRLCREIRRKIGAALVNQAGDAVELLVQGKSALC